MDVASWEDFAGALLAAEHVVLVVIHGPAAAALAQELGPEALSPDNKARHVAAGNATFLNSETLRAAIDPYISRATRGLQALELLDGDGDSLMTAYDWDAAAGPVYLYGELRAHVDELRRAGVISDAHEVDC